MSAALDAAARVRLSRLLGMLGSEHDGEALNAGRLADRLIKSTGLTWADVILGDVGKSERKRKPRRKAHAQNTPPKRANRPTWEQAAAQVLKSGLATPWETAFCRSLLRHWPGRRLSEKQLSTLATIWRERCASEAA